MDIILSYTRDSSSNKIKFGKLSGFFKIGESSLLPVDRVTAVMHLYIDQDAVHSQALKLTPVFPKYNYAQDLSSISHKVENANNFDGIIRIVVTADYGGRSLPETKDSQVIEVPFNPSNLMVTQQTTVPGGSCSINHP